MTAQSFQELLRNPIYAGMISVPTWGIERIKGDFESLVSLETLIGCKGYSPDVPADALVTPGIIPTFPCGDLFDVQHAIQFLRLISAHFAHNFARTI